jgi:Rieske Fe-S protein
MAFSLLLAWLWYSSVKKSSEIYSRNEETIISADIPNGISFYDKFIVIKSNASLKIFSSRCSHLGCLIKNKEGDEFVCPCHGSKYDFDGKVLKGPAKNPLKLLRFKREKDRIIIYES